MAAAAAAFAFTHHQRYLLLFFFLYGLSSAAAAIDFLFDSFAPADASSNLTLIGDARIDGSVLCFTNDSNYYSLGRVFYRTRLRTAASGGSPNPSLFSFSTSFVFSIVPGIETSPGFGLAFVLSNSTSPPGALAGQYFGVFSNATHQTPAPLLVVEFDTGHNPEFDDPIDNHVGVDLNFVVSSRTERAGFYRANGSSTAPEFLNMRSGRNIRAWIEFNGPRYQINVTIAPAEDPRPPRPLISYTDPVIANYVSPEMFVGFSASKVQWVEEQRVLAWSFSDTGSMSREINVSNLPNFSPPPPPVSSGSPSAGLIVGISVACIAVSVCFAGIYWYCRWRRRVKIRKEEDEDEEEWESKYWPRRFKYDDLWSATDGFSRERLLGFGGFGKVYRGVLPASVGEEGVNGGSSGRRVREHETEEVAVKCVSHDSKQGVREFMAEISSMGRLQHRSLVDMKGWCRKGNELMLVYQYMPNGNLSQWLFPEGQRGAPLGWESRRQVLVDVAEALLYLHQGWEQVVLHRDVKCSNILLDAGMRARLGDFGLAKLYERGVAPCSTRVVGTLGYLAPEMAMASAPTAAADVYSFGVVVLEVACGRRPIERAERVEDDDWVLVDWVRDMYAEKKLLEAADRRMQQFPRAEMELVLKLGLACCHPDPEQRPTMKEVVELLLNADNVTAL
ncbi:L-type lectin-domain containing receptor kinase S.1-like [Zingiber officinale]|uniref:non-specific serine/threonine protein kinase n=1 Tax=Zingiber officinale TaxID=94328 RepID=A0A8J5HIL2_ZINOF|nr:L-type lectin-domain containing receptor kinase S.1-like [Zingiber officinale]KAG6525476.1 hypothetical protein ZIOFF_015432 [Zingiber officinale]